MTIGGEPGATNLAAALGLASQGWLIIPCRPDKRPYLKGWPGAGTVEPATIAAWWETWPDALPGLPCGPNGLFVVDQDRHVGGADGVAEWERQCAANGVDRTGCLKVATPSGGVHDYFRQPVAHCLSNSAGKIGGGIDTRGDGGYVIAPGAVLPDGRTYSVISGALSSSPPVPPDLAAYLATKPLPEPNSRPVPDTARTMPLGGGAALSPRSAAYVAKTVADECERVRQAPTGQRNATFNSAVFSLATMVKNFAVGAAEMDALKSAAHAAGLDGLEVEATFNSALDAGLRQPRPPLEAGDLPPTDFSSVTVNGAMLFGSMRPAASSPVVAGDHAIIRRVSDVIAEPITWLWRDRVAIGKLTIIAGDPGLGKSQLTAYMAAKVTTAGAWPNDDGDAPFGNVIMLSCEDDVADTIRPRLEAVAADLHRVHVIEAVRTGQGIRGFSLTEDLTKLEAALCDVGDVRLVVVDPITAYLGGSDTHKTGDVRAALAPLQELASRYRIAVVAVSHFNKSAGGGKSINAVTGSAAFVAASRATFIVTKDNDNPLRRLLIEAKNNLAQASGLAFTVVETVLSNGIKAPHVVFEHGTVELTADQAIGEPVHDGNRSAANEAADFLKAELAGGPVAAKVVKANAKAAGISDKTLQRAADNVGVIKRKDGFQGEWVWSFAIAPNHAASLFADMPRAPLQAKGGQDGQVSTLENVGAFGNGWPSLAEKPEPGE